jgi:hypothetical protein
MPMKTSNRGPWTHRFLILLFTVVLTLLAFWLLGFVLSDIGSLRGPSYADVEKRFLEKPLIDESLGVEREIAGMERKLGDEKSRLTLLRDSTSGYQKTMNQLLEMQRLNIEKGIALPEEQQKTLSESVEFFIANQKKDQAFNEQIAVLSEELRGLQERKRELAEKMEGQRKPAREEFSRLERRHDLRLATLKLAFLLPLLTIAFFLFVKRRGGLYAPLVHAAGIAVLWRTLLVIHQYFPARVFKYIVIVAAIGIVVFVLVSLLRMIRFPKAEWLLKQYREAYEKFFCPVCEYPIRRGPLKYLAWTRRSLRRVTLPAGDGSDGEKPYVCPSCGSQLYEECADCRGIRPSLLPFCDRCGAKKEFAAGSPG